MANYGYQMPMYGQFSQPLYNQQLYNQQTTPPQNQDDRIWVANAQAADAYLIAPNSMVRLWDSNKNVFYEKRADATGRPLPIECYEYAKVEANKPVDNTSIDYLAEINRLNERISVLEERMVNKNEQSNGDNKRTKKIHEQLPGE